MPLGNVTLVGANGKLGPSILQALLKPNTYKITILQRASSKSAYPSPINVVRIPDAFPTSDLINALRGQDVLIVAFASDAPFQINLANAAAAAGVKRFIPADFGSCDSSSPRALELLPIYVTKQAVRQHLQKLTERMSWTSLICGHFFDYGLKCGLLQFDILNRRVKFFDSGEHRWSTSTLEDIGVAVVGILEKEEETRNRMLYMQSFSVSQKEVLGALERVGGGEWMVEEVDSGDFIRTERAKLEKGPGDEGAIEELVSVLGIVDADWRGKKDFANELLGIGRRDLDEEVRKAIS